MIMIFMIIMIDHKNHDYQCSIILNKKRAS